MSRTAPESEPTATPSRNSPPAQPRSDPRACRSASPAAPESRGEACGAPSRCATIPAPTSRRSANATATSTSITAATNDTSNGHQRSFPSGWVACDQPIGDSHTRASRRTSPAARTTYASPSSATETPSAVRAWVNTCAATSPTAANTTPSAVSDAPNSQAAEAGTSTAARTRAVPAPTTSDTSAATTIAAAPPEYRPTTVARSISLLPSSSSARVYRTTTSTPSSATPRTEVNETLLRTIPASVSTAIGGPDIATSAGDPATEAA